MKSLFLFLVTVALLSCSNEKPVETKSTTFIQQKLNEFIAANPNWVVEEKEAEITDKFKR